MDWVWATNRIVSRITVVNGDVVHPFRRACQKFGSGQRAFFAQISIHSSGILKQTDRAHPPC